MFIVNLYGRIGNQLFQYALGHALETLSKKPVFFSTDFLDPSEPIITEIFNIRLNRSSQPQLNEILGFRKTRIIRKILSHYPSKFITQNILYCDKNFIFNAKNVINIDNIYFHGYWQNLDVVNSIETELRSVLLFKDTLAKYNIGALQQIQQDESVALHVRRGDYLSKKNSKIYSLLDDDYYKKAISYLEMNIPNPKFFIFTDDPEYVFTNKIFSGGKFNIISTKKQGVSFNDFYLMSKCKHNIIANSTYSWWPAWLNSNPNKIVISPSSWFVNIKYSNNLIPNNWITL